MKPSQRFISTALILASFMAFAACSFNAISSPTISDDQSQHGFTQPGNQVAAAATGAYTPAVNVEYENTAYSIHYRLVEYEKVFSYTGVSNVMIIGVSYFHFNKNTYRCMAFKNGTINVANITNTQSFSWPNEHLNVKGYNFQVLPSFKIHTTTFEPQKLFTEASILNADIAIAGRNTTTNELTIFLLRYSEATTKFIYVKNYTIPNPAGFTISDVDVYDCYREFNNEDLIVSGKYIDSSAGNVPFGYMIEDLTGTVIYDVTNVTTSTTDYLFFGEAVWAMRRFSSPKFWVLTNNKVLIVNILNHVDSWIHAIGIPILAFVSYVGKGMECSGGVAMVPYCYFDPPNSATVLVSWNQSDDTIVERLDPASVGVISEVVAEDTVIKATSDLGDGVVFAGSDFNFRIWQDWVFGTGSIGGPFDFYVPYQIINLNIGSNMACFEIWWGDSRGMWVSIFNVDDSGVLGVGKSHVNKVVTQRADVFHSRGTNQFTFSVSGYLERNTSDLVEIGIIPLYVRPTTTGSETGSMFSITKTHLFSNKEGGGIILRPSRAFIGTGSVITEFQCNFDADYCPITSIAPGLPIMLMQVQYLVYEKYSNGTYTQKLCRTFFNSKTLIFMFSYQMETSISIQDSHMLDELRVLSGGIEYNPYSLSFLQPDLILHVIDKITNKTLFNHTVRFQDPLLLPIPAKYEYALRYYSSLDFFGLDFGLVNTYVNGTQVAIDQIRVLSPTSRIITTDFANSTISDVVVDKAVDGVYINLPLPIATVIISNNYNFTIIFYIIKNDVAISYSIPTLASVMLRLATGHYRYVITDVEGDEIIDREIDFTSSTSVAVGDLNFLFPVDPTIQARTEINILIAVIGIAAIAATGIIIANAYVKRKGVKTNKRSWG